MTDNHLKSIDGIRIRRQYFNAPIYSIWLASAFVTEISLCLAAVSSSYTDLLVSVLSATVFALVFPLPFVLLSYLNRKYFGKIVCVLDGEGIHYDEGLIRWENILSMTFVPSTGRVILDRRETFCHIMIETVRGIVRLYGAPLYMLSKAKCFSPTVKTRLSPMFVAFISLVFILAAIFALVL